MRVNQAAIQLIKEFEGFRAEAYKDPVGIWTIGYGTTANADVGIVPKAGMKITEADATEYLWRAVNRFAAQVDSALTREANENEFGAMVSLAYNIGPGAFKRSSVLRQFNTGNTEAAANAFLMWNKAGGKVLRGLTRRREAERALFLTPARPDLPAKPAPRIDIFAIIGATIRLLFSNLFGGRK
jgi:lysozyme